MTENDQRADSAAIAITLSRDAAIVLADLLLRWERAGELSPSGAASNVLLGVSGQLDVQLGDVLYDNPQYAKAVAEAAGRLASDDDTSPGQ